MRERDVLCLYSEAAFRQIVLPAVNHADYTVRLSARQFHFRQEVCLNLEVINHRWYLHWEEERYSLYEDDFLRLKLNGGDLLSVISYTEPSLFRVSKKYGLTRNSPITIGSAPDNQICYQAFQLISACHAVIFWNEEAYWIADQSRNGVYINGKRVTDRQILYFGDCIDLFGLRMVFLKEAAAICCYTQEDQADIHLQQDLAERLPELAVRMEAEEYYRRHPRQWKEIHPEEIEIEGPGMKSEPERQSLLLSLGPSLTLALPMMISASVSGGGGGGEALYTGLYTALSMAFFGLFWGILHWFFRKREKKWEEKRRKVVYKNYLGEAEQYIAERYQRERDILLERYPAFSLPDSSFWRWSSQLWSRNPAQEDFLYQRVGLGDMPFSMTIRVPRLPLLLFRDDLREEPVRLRERYEKLRDVPICVDLGLFRVVGIVGGMEQGGAAGLAAGLLLQVAVNHCYTDVKVAFLYDEADTEMSQLANLVKWLPHVWAEGRGMRYLAGNRTEASKVLRAMGEICRNPMKKHYLLFVADQRVLEGEGFCRYMFSQEKGIRLTTVFLGEGMEDMPNDCQFFMQNNSYFSGIVSGGMEKKVVYDRISLADGIEAARKLAGIRVKKNEAEGEVQEYVSFLSLFPEDGPEEMDIVGRWRKSRIDESMRVPVGKMAGGRLLYLDAHEKHHGPHGLIAGTTGAGKSEALQTYLLSLAVQFSPDDVAFFIIDYKGGGMGNLFGGLPHTVGTVSNLSGNQIRRALISIKSENEKRQRRLQQYGMNHINQYTTAFQRKKVPVCMPHLFIVVDEFAELKREEPEFMKELVSVAQVGRSLGIHLILATQKPAGIVDDHIWSNTRFRLCLRVQDRQDSMDMLHRPDAAALTGVGRCYLQVGNDEVFELFQTAYSGAVYEENSKRAKRESRMLTRTGTDALANQKWRKQNTQEREGILTQSEKVMACIKRAGKESECAGSPPLWLPPLPDCLGLEELEVSAAGENTGETKEPLRHLTAWVGLCDHPARQRQYPLKVDLYRQGNILICGGPATGKSTILQTLLYSLMKGHSPAEVECYLIDCSLGMLRSFGEMPHVAGLSGGEADQWERIFYRLRQEWKKRKEGFAGGSFIHRKDREGIPAILLAIDHYGGFKSEAGEKYDEFMLQLAAEGKNNGIFLILTAAGIGMGEVPGKLAGNFGYRLCLEMVDSYQYGEILAVNRHTANHGIYCNGYPEGGKKGRGMVKEEEGVLEFQTALVGGEENDFIRMERIEEEAKVLRKKYYPYAARGIPEVPAQPDFASFYRQVREQGELLNREKIPIGYVQESGTIYEILLKNTHCFLITGRKGSGKSNLLRIISRMAGSISQGAVLPVWMDWTGRSGHEEGQNICLISSDEQLYQWLEELSPLLQQRNRQIHAGSGEKFPPLFIMIDNLADFYRHVLHPAAGVKPMEAFVEHIWKKGSGHGIYWFAGWNPENEPELSCFPICQIFMGYGTGVHLGGNAAAQRTFHFSDLTYAEQSKVGKPGIAWVPPDETAGTVRVILPFMGEDKEGYDTD